MSQIDKISEIAGKHAWFSGQYRGGNEAKSPDISIKEKLPELSVNTVEYQGVYAC